MFAKMRNFASTFVHFSSAKISCFHQCFLGLFLSSIRFLVLKVNPLWIQLSYFISISSVGYLILRVSKPRDSSFINPKNIDVFFTSVSAMTGSSMSTVEMEVFSNFQLIIMTILMFVGGEVFISMFGLHARSKFYSLNQLFENRINPNLTPSSSSSSSSSSSENSTEFTDQIELGIVSHSYITNEEPNNGLENEHRMSSNDDNLKYNSVRVLVYVVLGYILVTHVVGSSLVALYTSLAPSAKQILKQKGLQIFTFSVFTTASTFSNCGFVPTNENMMVFKKNALLLLILFPQGLLGNTLYPSCLRFVIWVLKKITNREEFDYILRNSKEMIYRHLLSKAYSYFLAITVFGFIFVQLVLFCALEWDSEATDGLNFFEKLVASLFQVVNSRHTGESVFDISIVSPAILVLFVVMIAYGNVGFSTGYSCKRQLRPDSSCKDAWYGFVGRWSNQGKVILILVMFFGRIKKFNMKGGKAWQIS
ncbi:putative cation transporter HKT6 [Citrus sinensis]|nr:putative cation transporter HKT6 [Citrus sinensis]